MRTKALVNKLERDIIQLKSRVYMLECPHDNKVIVDGPFGYSESCKRCGMFFELIPFEEAKKKMIKVKQEEIRELRRSIERYKDKEAEHCL